MPNQIEQLKIQIQEMQRTISNLEQKIVAFDSAPSIDHDQLRAIEVRLAKDSGEAVGDYDQAVVEDGASSYNVAKVYDGMLDIGGVIVGYYNKV